MTMARLVCLIIIGLINYSVASELVQQYTVHSDYAVKAPLPNERAADCLIQMKPQLLECRNRSISNWNVHDTSPLADVCCAQFDLLDCDVELINKLTTLDYKLRCSNEEIDEVNDYFDDLVDFYNDNICHPFQRGGTHCSLPILAKATKERPPEPSPQVIDCLASIRPAVRFHCYEEAAHKWNITCKKHPIKNLCCATWDNIDCLDAIVKVRCPNTEIDATEQYFKQIESWAAQVGPCKQASYHSSNCTTKTQVKEMANVAKLDDSYIPFVFPAKPARSEEQAANVMDDDYRDFLMNYILTVFPHLLNLLVLLTVVLVAIIVVQCFLIGRQIKRDQLFRSPITYNGYQKVNHV